MSELDDLRRRVEVLEEMLVLRVATFDDNLDLQGLRNEDARNHMALVSRVDKRVRDRQHDRMTQIRWNGDLDQLRQELDGKATAVLDHGRLTIVCRGKTTQYDEGDWMEITEDGRVRPCRSPEKGEAYEASLEFYRGAAR